ncbi:MAG TPA: DUF5671 domain-containing protein, partial [Anaerolineaceae bacterium]|nr:DUF5671 domain-containing protein [Anaerolineaceae bacterium]
RAVSEAGSHARRSLLRKGYLYLVIFLAVIGAMFAAGSLLFQVIGRLLGNPAPNLTLEVVSLAVTLAALLVWLAYHLGVLRADGALAEQALAARHAAFPALILQAEDGRLTAEIVQALRRESPQMPVTVHLAAAGAPGAELPAAQVLVIPAAVALAPPAELRAWLQDFGGKKVIVPGPSGDTVWAGAPPRPPAETARAVARAVRQLAEGEAVRGSAPVNAWVIVGYALAGLFALQLGALLIVLVFSFID